MASRSSCRTPRPALPRSGPGGRLGYATTVTPSVVVKFDTSSGAQATNYVALMLNGSTTATAQATTPIAGAGMIYGWVDYSSSGTINIYVSTTATKPGAPTVTHAINSPYSQLGSGGKMYVGFSAATGATAAASNLQDVYELEISTDGVPCTCEGDSACSGATPACGVSGICTICTASNSTACTGATPVCDVPINTCVGCLTNTDCTNPTEPICDTSSLACRPCSSAADCGGATPECATAGPNTGECVICIGNSDCSGTTPRCTANNTCVQCLGPGDCGGDTPICSAAGVCEPCGSDADCSGATPACEISGACGQCSSTNSTACAISTDAGTDGGAKRICDYPSGTCVACEFNSDCSGMTPRCDTTYHTCQPCQSNADCVGNLNGPACALYGMKLGSCVICAQDSDCTNPAASKCDTTSNQCVNCLKNADCPAATPECSTADICVGCLSDTDCHSVTKPVCDTSDSQCKPCANDYSATNPSALNCPTAALPACQPAGSPLAGQCGVCSSVNDSVCATEQATPVCVTSTATCGCLVDTNCMTNYYCDTSTTSTGVCTKGCRILDSGIDNCQTGYYCSFAADGGTIGTCTSEPCNSNGDCNTTLPVCDTIVQPHICVQCLNSSDCKNSFVCDQTDKCVECTSSQTQNCLATSKGNACLEPSEKCGCTADNNCGGATSGRVCDTTTQACETGCRGTGGNGCPLPDVCSSKTSAIGQCGAAPKPDASTVTDAGFDAGHDATVAVDGGPQGHVITQSVGSGCSIAWSERGGERAGALGGLLVGLALAVRRRRSR